MFPPLRVSGGDDAWTFDRPFHIGREQGCEIWFDGHPRVSRKHLHVYPEGGTWWVEDLASANGLLVGGARVVKAEVTGAIDIEVGEGGPHLRLSAGGEQRTEDGGSEPDAAAAPSVLDDDLTAERPRLGAELFGGVSSDPGPLLFEPPPADPFPADARAEAPRHEAPRADETPRSDAPPAGHDAPPRPEAPLRPGPSGELGTNGTPPAPGASTRPTAADGTPLSYEAVVKHYFTEGDEGDEAGERTRFIRQAYVDIQKATEKEHHAKQSRYRTLLIASLGLCVVALGYAGYREYTVRQLEEQAQQIFYQLQTNNVAFAEQVAAVEQQIEQQPERADSLRGSLDAALAARQQTAAKYDQFIRGLGVYDDLSSEDEAIYRVARAFGESELTIPREFVDEVKVYVNKWKRSNRFQTAVRTAEVNGYIPVTVEALRRYGLPPEFFYLSMQESNFDTKIVGPPTRYGYAKGAWQFIPETGKRYGLEPGPLVAQAVYDPLDERQDFDAAAPAAAHYLHDIYVHLSQASGLLVCASYNWGEGRIRRNMDDIQRQLAQAGIPNDPSHRTYWKFLTEYRNQMPAETRDYVMNIFAAAVIGQNPRMFGIDMDPPLSTASIRRSGNRVRAPEADPSRPARRMGSSALQQRQQTAPPSP